MLSDPDRWLPMASVTTFIAAAIEKSADDNLGLHAAERCEPESFDVHLYAMVSSPTLGAAFDRLCRYQRMIHETTRIEIDRDEGRAIVRHRGPGPLTVPRHSAEFLLASWVRVGRIATASAWAPIEVHFAHPAPGNVADHRHFFASPVIFSAGENALVIPEALLDEPCRRSDPALLRVLDRYAADRLEAAPRSSGTVDRIRNVIADELKNGEPAASRVATRLKMSVRTLGRSLAAEHTSFRALLDTYRKELAIRHLGGNQCSIQEIAFLLGFSELSAFHRAFKRWTGETPADCRRRIHNNR